jgi:hypothetical protein
MGLFNLPRKKEESIHVVREEEAEEKGIEPGLYRDGEPYTPGQDDYIGDKTIDEAEREWKEEEKKRKIEEKIARQKEKQERVEEKLKGVRKRVEAKSALTKSRAELRKSKTELRRARREALAESIAPVTETLGSIKSNVEYAGQMMKESSLGTGEKFSYDEPREERMADKFDFSLGKGKDTVDFSMGQKEGSVLDVTAKSGSIFDVGSGKPSNKFDFSLKSDKFSLAVGSKPAPAPKKKSKKKKKEKESEKVYILPGNVKL